MEPPGRFCGSTRRSVLATVVATLLFAWMGMARGNCAEAIERQPVESSVLASAGYDARARVLEVEFHSGAIYRYLEVPAEIFQRLLAAESKGQFFGKHIRDKFRSERVKARTAK